MAEDVRAQSEPIDGSAAGQDPVGAIEAASAMLVRNFELLQRRSDSYTDLDRSEYLLLYALEQTGPTDIATLAATLGLDHSTAARQVAAMRHKELISSRPGSSDRRRCVLTPTAEGRQRLESTRERRRANTAALLADWPQTDLRTLATMFTRYNQAVAHTYLAPPHPATATDVGNAPGSGSAAGRGTDEHSD